MTSRLEHAVNASAKCEACEHYGRDAHQRTGCLLLDGCPRRIKDHVNLGGGCVHPTHPRFAAHASYEPPKHPLFRLKSGKRTERNTIASEFRHSILPGTNRNEPVVQIIELMDPMTNDERSRVIAGLVRHYWTG